MTNVSSAALSRNVSENNFSSQIYPFLFDTNLNSRPMFRPQSKTIYCSAIDSVATVCMRKSAIMGHERRRMSEKKGMEVRNQQAARDALRRRQKAKKAKTVKRHVRYKDRKKLLADLDANQEAAPIVASDLRQLVDNEDDLIEVNPQRTKSVTLNKREKQNETKSGEANAEDTMPVESDSLSNVGNKPGPVEAARAEEPKGKTKYMPFSKQIKAYEKLKGQKEAQRREQQKKIKIREKMLRKSKKERKERVSSFAL